jgi:hypothetical protein
VTPIVQMRKEPRVVSVTSEDQPRRISKMASAHIPASLLDILGLNRNSHQTDSPEADLT